MTERSIWVINSEMVNGASHAIKIKLFDWHGAVRLYVRIQKGTEPPKVLTEYWKKELDSHSNIKPDDVLTEILSGVYGNTPADFLRRYWDMVTERPPKFVYRVSKDRNVRITQCPHGFALACFELYNMGVYQGDWSVINNTKEDKDSLQNIKLWAVKHLDSISYIQLRNNLENHNFRW